MKQRDIFLASEGDAYFARNLQGIAGQSPEVDELLREVIGCLPANAAWDRVKVLEIGCGDGARLVWLKNNLNADCYGLEPSAQAVNAACSRGVKGHQGTADSLPFDDQSLDIVVFGYSLCWCDREDLFQVASEAHRVLRSPGWLLIGDFYSPTPRTRSYHYRPNVQTLKMDFRTLFTWHPDYECMSHRISNHGEVVHGIGRYTDDPDEWIAISVLRKHERKLNV